MTIEMTASTRRNIVPDIIICSIVLGSVSIVYLLASFIRWLLNGEHSPLTLAQLIDEQSPEYGWMLKLFVNCLGYECILVPCILIYLYTQRINYLKDGRPSGWISDAVRFCFRSADPSSLPVSVSSATGGKSSAASHSTLTECLLYAYCFTGLNISYLSWGLLQEKIITREYHDGSADNPPERFGDSQFLVFVNRTLAFGVSAAWLFWLQPCWASRQSAAPATPTQRHRVAPFKYSYAALSNIMSAWFQYEALKFVSFPTQVLAKSCKIIPVMLMGRIVSRTRYEFYEYLTACLISLGMVCFLLGSADGAPHRSSITTISGVLLLVLYLLFDSFTSNWQSDLFRTYEMSPVQMMCGVSAFSALFTGASLALQGGFAESLHFAAVHPAFLVDCMVLSASSVVGVLFIFYTISKFGAVGFTIIMTIRQAFAILLSCIVYDHYITPFGIVGICIVFLAIFVRVYCSHRLKSIRRKADAMRSQRLGA